MPQKRSLGNVHYDNRDRVAIVTGGSNGIGAAICRAFADSGGLVVSADIQEPHGHSPHANIHFRKLDVSSESQCEEVVRWTKETFGGIDLLVNNAAIQPPSSYVRLDQVNDQEFQRMLGVNFCGYHFMAKHVARVLMEQESGVIINIASGQGHRTARQVPVYGPLKAANLLQTMQWGVEYARYGIRVVSVSPARSIRHWSKPAFKLKVAPRD